MDKELLDREFTLENKTGITQTIRLYKVNFPIKLATGDSIKLAINSSEELAYYMKLQEGLEGAEATAKTPRDYLIDTLKFFGTDYVSVGDEERGSGVEKDEEFNIGDEVIPETTYLVYYFMITFENGNRTQASVYVNDERVIATYYDNRGSGICEFVNNTITNSQFNEIVM